MTTYAFGHLFRIYEAGVTVAEYQNFFIEKNVVQNGLTYRFLPFGFSGVTVNRSGDGLESTVVLPNNALSKSWAVRAINNNYVAEVDVLLINRELEPNASHNIVHTYTGQIVGGNWDETSLNLSLSSVLDAVGTDVPRRSLTKDLVGNLPITSNVRLQ